MAHLALERSCAAFFNGVLERSPSPTGRPIVGTPGDRESRRRRAEVLCAAGDAAIGKGDLDLAERLFIQADVDDPRCRYPQDRLAMLDRDMRGRCAPPCCAAHPGRKFDFLYAPTLRGLSTELSTLLPLHPELFSVAKQELDSAIESGTESSLLAKYQRRILRERPDLKAGLVQHSFIAGQLAKPDVAQRLAAVTTRKLFVHGVRDPLSLVISDFNHELIAQFCGSYRFSALHPETPFGNAVHTLPLPRTPVQWARQKQQSLRARLRPPPSGRGHSAELAPFSLNPAVIEKRLDEALSRPRHFAVGNCYAQHFDSWVPIDLGRRAPPHRHVANRLFAAIGVDAGFEHPAFRASEGTSLHRLMVQNYIQVDACGHGLLLGLGFADRMMYSNTFPMSEILAFDADDRFAELGLADHRLCVTVPRSCWRQLPRNFRIKLVESQELATFCNAILIPAWLDSCARWKSTVSRYLIKELDSSVAARLRARIGTDLEQFLKRHPTFEPLWASSVDALWR